MVLISNSEVGREESGSVEGERLTIHFVEPLSFRLLSFEVGKAEGGRWI